MADFYAEHGGMLPVAGGPAGESWMAGPAAVSGVDPSRVSTPDELAACLDGLRRRRGLSYEAMEKAAAKLPSRSGGSRLEPLP